jgi:hypothetical protein
VVDLRSGCLLRESLVGFREAIAAGRTVCPTGTVVPGANRLSWPATGPVLLECALGLVDQLLLSKGASYSPYVDFTWPVPVKIREFFPRLLSPRPGDSVIATYAGAPVALRRGRLILLGSAIGPSLATGDPDAHRWLSNVLDWMHASRSSNGCPDHRGRQ